MLKKLNTLLVLFGIDLPAMARSLAAVPWYLLSLAAVRRLGRQQPNEFPFGKLYPCLADRADNSGLASGHYFHQDLLVARKLFLANPARHIDIGSRIDGFVAHVASFREIEVFDIRDLPDTAVNIRFRRLDLMTSRADPEPICDSLSCLHALEHFGLGRYGDVLDLDGHLKGFKTMSGMLKPGGTFYLSVPMGTQRIEFNAHRVFSLNYLLKMTGDEFDLYTFSYVDDAGSLHENAVLDPAALESNCGCHYGCAILELIKKPRIHAHTCST